MEFVMESLASGFLLVTLISLIFALRRRSKSYTSATVRAKERTVIHINFVAAMAALHLTKLAGETMHANYVLCATAVVLRCAYGFLRLLSCTSFKCNREKIISCLLLECVSRKFEIFFPFGDHVVVFFSVATSCWSVGCGC